MPFAALPRRLVLLAAALAAATGAMAQTPTPAPRPPAPAETPAEAPAAPAAAAAAPAAAADAAFPPGVPADEAAEGTEYTAEVTGDWEVRCFRTGLAADPCHLYQLLKEPNGNPVGEFTVISLPPGGQVAAGASLLVPLEVDLQRQVTIRVDAGQARRYGFTVCSAIGCLARFGLTTPEVQAMQRGAMAVVTVTPFVAPDNPIALDMSLRGFTAGLEAVRTRNAAAEAAARAAAAAAPPAAPGN